MDKEEIQLNENEQYVYQRPDDFSWVDAFDCVAYFNELRKLQTFRHHCTNGEALKKTKEIKLYFSDFACGLIIAHCRRQVL
jgi:hypothetical protein